ncbi:MAG: cyclase family protein [Pseudomonadota bacterium]
MNDGAKYNGTKDGVFHFPGFSPDTAEWLMKEHEVVGLASDTLSLDNGPSKDFKVHTTWLPGGALGAGERRQPRQGARVRRNARCRRCKGQRRDRRAGAADRAGMI